MLSKSKASNNYTVLRNLLSKTRKTHLPSDAQYLVIYAFIYKYYSDSLKDHFLMVLQNHTITLNQAYNSLEFSSELKNDAFKLYGYYIESADAFFDEVMDKKFTSPTFLKEFFDAFRLNVSFQAGSSEEKYMNFIFSCVKTDFNPQTADLVKDIIYSISQLDIFDGEFPYCDVFDAFADSRLLNVKSNPEYIYQILSAVLASRKNNPTNIYDPFMTNGDSFLSLLKNNNMLLNSNFGKEEDRLTFCFTIARLYMHYYNCESFYFENEDATESVDINQASFDAIMSVIPIEIRNYHTSNRNLSLEIAKRNKRAQLKDVLSQNFDMDFDSLSGDSNLNNALEELINKMDVETDSSSQFGGEYEELNDSEFLFLINLINSLKDDGVMAISISENFLFKPSLNTLRKYLTYEKNYIDTIINIPNEFGRYKRPEVVIVFRKNKNNEDILFIDMSRDFSTKRGRLMVPGLFRRNLLLSNETIDKMVYALVNYQTIPKYSEVIKISQIIENNFNLSVSKYVDTFEGEFIDLKQLARDKKEIDQKQAELTQKIGLMMKELNIRF